MRKTRYSSPSPWPGDILRKQELHDSSSHTSIKQRSRKSSGTNKNKDVALPELDHKYGMPQLSTFNQEKHFAKNRNLLKKREKSAKQTEQRQTEPQPTEPDISVQQRDEDAAVQVMKVTLNAILSQIKTTQKTINSSALSILELSEKTSNLANVVVETLSGKKEIEHRLMNNTSTNADTFNNGIKLPKIDAIISKSRSNSLPPIFKTHDSLLHHDDNETFNSAKTSRIKKIAKEKSKVKAIRDTEFTTVISAQSDVKHHSSDESSENKKIAKEILKQERRNAMRRRRLQQIVAYKERMMTDEKSRTLVNVQSAKLGDHLNDVAVPETFNGKKKQNENEQ